MTATDSVRSAGDVRLRIWLGDTALDYTATVEAARNLICDWRRNPCFTIELICHPVGDHSLPRLPCERLFIGS